jgi:hypothetical protein
MTSFIGRQYLPRGLRDNNVGNIRPNPSYTWYGQIGVENGYVIFEDIEHSIRAMGKDLSNKIKRGLNTLDRYIPVYAPPADNNNTQAYIDTVATLSGFAPTDILIPNVATLFKLVKAHIHVEIGSPNDKLITDDMVHNGLALM